MLNRTRAVCIAALLLGVPTYASVGRPRGHKNFPATHDSVRLENEVANSMGAYRYFTQAQVDTDVNNRHLSALHDSTVYVVSPKLPIERRYALPATANFVYELSKEF